MNLIQFNYSIHPIIYILLSSPLLSYPIHSSHLLSCYIQALVRVSINTILSHLIQLKSNSIQINEYQITSTSDSSHSTLHPSKDQFSNSFSSLLFSFHLPSSLPFHSHSIPSSLPFPFLPFSLLQSTINKENMQQY